MAVLGRARLGMLAVNTGRWPLVNPAAFHFASGSLWMTTSRYAAKVSLARRDPRAAFLADGGSVCLLLQGVQEAYDLRSLRGQLRAALEGPGFYWSLAGYAAKNAPFVMRGQLKMVTLVMVPTLGYVALIEWLGIYVASTIYIALFMWWLGKYSWIKFVSVSVGVNVAFFLMFEIWFKVPLPKGPLEAALGLN